MKRRTITLTLTDLEHAVVAHVLRDYAERTERALVREEYTMSSSKRENRRNAIPFHNYGAVLSARSAAERFAEAWDGAGPSVWPPGVNVRPRDEDASTPTSPPPMDPEASTGDSRGLS